MNADDGSTDLSAAERRLDEHLELLRASPPDATLELVPQVIRAVRWQRAIRDPLLLVGAVAAAFAETARFLLESAGGQS